MNWLKLIIKPDTLPVEQVEEVLESLGAEAVTLEDAGDQPLLEPRVGETPLWEATVVTGLFPAERGSQALNDALIQAWPGVSVPDFSLEVLEDRDWSLVWSEHAQPMAFADRLWVLPREADEIPPPHATVVHIPPGLAFGTGTHPTTALCLEWLATRVEEGKTLTDYGSGSGILAVAAACLGASTVTAVDNDPQALTATTENARINHVADRVRVFAPEEAPDEATDILIANILANPLIELAPRLAGLVRPGGRIALTGILDHQADSVADAYAPWFPEMSRSQDAEWVLLSGTRASVPRHSY